MTNHPNHPDSPTMMMPPADIASPAEPLRRLSVLMPVYNERWTLEQIVRRVLSVELPLELELVAVDDCSRDGSWDVLRELADHDRRIRAVRHERNQGKGAAVRTAIAHMTGDVAVVQDADLEYNPAEYPRLLAPILSGEADAVFGSRYAGSPRKVHPFWHTLINQGLTLCSNALNNLTLSDMETCYKMVRGDILRQLSLKSRTFTLEPEITCRLAQWGARIYEVPVSYTGRSFAEGKKIRPLDGVKALYEMVRCRFFDRRFTHHDRLQALKTADGGQTARQQVLATATPYLGQHVAELGAGLGSLSVGLLNRPRLLLMDDDPLMCRILRQRFGGRLGVAIVGHDWDSPDLHNTLCGQQLDTLICTDVLARVAQPSAWLRQCAKALMPRGHCLLLSRGGAEPAAEMARLSEALSTAGFDVVGQHSLAVGRRQRRCLVVGQKPQPEAMARAA